MEKCTDDILPNGNHTPNEEAVLRQPLAPPRGKMPEGQKGGRVVRSYQFAYPDRIAILKDNARKNRIGQTDAEKVLWEYLRRNALGVRFRRQFIIGDFITDFACIEKKLVVEVDGLYHSTEEQIEEDRKRTFHLSQLGFRVLRFTNEEIMTDINKVILTIKTNLYEQ
jgi:very-short-patch-repair endonuclease